MVTKNTTKIIKKQLRKVEPPVRGVVSVIDVATRVTMAIAVIALTDNQMLTYVAYYMAGTSLLEIAYSVWGKNAKPLDR